MTNLALFTQGSSLVFKWCPLTSDEKLWPSEHNFPLRFSFCPTVLNLLAVILVFSYVVLTFPYKIVFFLILLAWYLFKGLERQERYRNTILYETPKQNQSINGACLFSKKIVIDLRRMRSCSPWPEKSLSNNFLTTNDELGFFWYTAFEIQHQKSHSLSSSNGPSVINLIEIATCDLRWLVVMEGLAYSCSLFWKKAKEKKSAWCWVSLFLIKMEVRE